MSPTYYMVQAKQKMKSRWLSWAESFAMSPFELGVAVLLMFSFLSGVQAHLMPAVYPVTQYTTDPLLFVICAGLLYLIYQRQQDTRLWLWTAVTYIGTFATEAIGVATGLVFGEYHYGDTMWAQWLGVPFVIALNWALLILATNDLAERWFKHPLVISLVASLLIVAYDVAIEPVAIKLDYWQWHAGDIPLQNYLAWGVIAFVFSLPLHYFKVRYHSPLLIVYAIAQLVFFLLLNAFL